MRTAVVLLLAAPLALAADPAPGAAGAPAPLKFGMASAPTSKEIAQKQAKLLEPYLSEKLGRPVTITISETYAQLIDDLAAGNVDAAWMQPLPFVRARAKNAEVAAVAKVIRNGAGFYRSVIFARAKKGIATIPDLKGKRAAWVDRHSTSGYLFPLVLMHAQGWDADNVFAGQEFLGSHAAVCQAVETGKADVGATYMDVPADGKPMEIDGCKGKANVKNLVVVDMSGPISNDVIAVRAGASPEEKEKFRAVFMEMQSDKKARKILKEVFEGEAFGAVGEHDFSAVTRGWEIIRDMRKLDLTEK